MAEEKKKDERKFYQKKRIIIPVIFVLLSAIGSIFVQKNIQQLVEKCSNGSSEACKELEDTYEYKVVDGKKVEKFSANEQNKLEQHKNEHSEFLVVAEIKSVNDQPVEFLEFKLKRFVNEESCQMWMNENSTLVTKSLNSHISKLKQGYFIDSVKCLKTNHFLLKPETRGYTI